MATFTPAVIRDRTLHNGYTVIGAPAKRDRVLDADFSTPLPARPPLFSQEEMVARIEAARLEDAPPVCTTCGSTTPAERTRRCWMCDEVQPLTAFNRNATQPYGRQYECRACARQIKRQRYLDQKRQQFREILGRAG